MIVDSMIPWSSLFYRKYLEHYGFLVSIFNKNICEISEFP